MNHHRCFLLALFWPATAVALVELGQGALTLDGNLRATSIATQNYDQSFLWGDGDTADGQSDLAVRLVATGKPRATLKWNVHVVQRLTFNTAELPTTGSSTLLGRSGTQVPYRTIDTRWEWSKADDVNAWIYFDRANIELTLGRADVAFGRQAITFGKAYFWNPLDVFLAFGSTEFDRDYKAGVDALRVDAPIGDLSGLTIVGVPGRVEEQGPQTDEQSFWSRSALLARVYGNRRSWDLAVQGGKILGGYQLGGAIAGELGTMEVRGEGAWFVSQDASAFSGLAAAPVVEDHFSIVAGFGRSFVGGDLQLQAEYYYNGAARGSRVDRLAMVAAGRLQHLNRHLLGIVGSYRLHPLLSSSLAALWGASDGSWLLQPGLSYSAADEVELIAGAIVARGRRPSGRSIEAFGFRSEFGTYPNFYYLETKLYF